MAVNSTHNVLLLEFENLAHHFGFNLGALLKLRYRVCRVVRSALFKVRQQFSERLMVQT